MITVQLTISTDELALAVDEIMTKRGYVPEEQSVLMNLLRNTLSRMVQHG